MDFFLFFFSLLPPKVYFLWLELQVFVLGQSVPPPPHLPGGFPEKPAAELAVRHCRHSRPSARVPASSPPPPPPPPAGLERPASASLPAPSSHCTRKPARHGHPRKSRSNQLAETAAVTGCRFD